MSSLCRADEPWPLLVGGSRPAAIAVLFLRMRARLSRPATQSWRDPHTAHAAALGW